MKMLKAIVICCKKTGLAVIRSLAREKIPIIGLCYGDDQVGSFSRYLAESFWCPDPNDDEPGFIRFLWSLADRYPGAVLFPADDASLVTLSRNREELETRYRVVAQDWSVVRRLIEKRLTYELLTAMASPARGSAPPATLPKRWSSRARLASPSAEALGGARVLPPLPSEDAADQGRRASAGGPQRSRRLRRGADAERMDPWRRRLRGKLQLILHGWSSCR